MVHHPHAAAPGSGAPVALFVQLRIECAEPVVRWRIYVGNRSATAIHDAADHEAAERCDRCNGNGEPGIAYKSHDKVL